jgi:hypothetical protein
MSFGGMLTGGDDAVETDEQKTVEVENKIEKEEVVDTDKLSLVENNATK